MTSGDLFPARTDNYRSGVKTATLPPGHQFASDEAVMRHALALAETARGAVEPNPMVGSVIVDERRRLIADGYHKEFGGPHAEVDALSHAGESAQGQTAFVTLEPCAHHGKQPPCIDALIAANIRRVVCAMSDPFPEVSGRGFEKLREAGIDIEIGLLEAEARLLNAPFLKRVHAAHPYVIAKYAMTLDGKMAASSGHSMWISGPESRAEVHAIRGRVDAIIVGSGTANIDNPQLTARPAGLRSPVRVVIGGRTRPLDLEADLVASAHETPTRYYVPESTSREFAKPYEEAGVDVVPVAVDDSGLPDVAHVLTDLAASVPATNVLLEGGSQLLGRFRSADAIDEYRVFVSPKIIGAGLPPMGAPNLGLAAIPEQPNVSITTVERTGDDVAVTAIVPRPWLQPRS